MDKALTDLRKSPQQKRATATLEAIVEAAAHILREGGAEALTTNAIAARAGVSIGSLYQYFPNKQAIVRAMIAREFKLAEAIRPATIDGDGATEEVVRAIVDWHFDFRARDPVLILRLAALARETLPDEERVRVSALRRERVARTVAKLLARTSNTARPDAAFFVDVCINAVADETLRRHPERLTCSALRAEATLLLMAYLEG